MLETQHPLTRLLDNNFYGGFMAYNNYGSPYGYMGNNYGGVYQPNIYQPPMPVPQQNQAQYETPIQGVMFMTSDEAKAYIVPPNRRVMIMDRDKAIFYVKSADALGQSSTTAYKFEQIKDSEPQVEIEATTIDTKDFVKKADIESFVTDNDLKKLKSELEHSIEDIKKSVIKKALGDENR